MRDMKADLKSARMHHSMIYIEERGYVIAVGGEEENNGGLLSSCEQFNIGENSWKMFNSLNNSGKNLSLCKFVKDSKTDTRLVLYCFGRNFVERIDLNKIPLDSKWEELKFKYKESINLSANCI
jgi:hypothetical protein